MIIGIKNDTASHYPMQEWLGNAYEVEIKTIGGHTSHMFNIDLY